MSKPEIIAALCRVEETLQTAQYGLDDLLDKSRKRRMSGLRNLIVFGRSVTWVLQNLKSVLPAGEFNRWYEPQQEVMKNDPVMQHFKEARNLLEKQGRLNVSTSGYISSLSLGDINALGPPPPGATAFFIADQLGGSGWEVEFPDGTVEKYYVDLPSSIGEVTQYFSDLRDSELPELTGRSIEELSQEYINRLRALVTAARSHWLPVSSS